jgi:hypothetical protein
VSGITFFVFVVSNNVDTNWTYNNIDGRIYFNNSGVPSNTIATSPELSGSVYNLGVSILGTPTTGLTRQMVVDTLDTKLSAFTWNSGASRLRASLNANGTLRLTIQGTQLGNSGAFRNFFAGLAFGDAPNGSTSLGSTNQNGVAGVAGAALVIVEGQMFVDSPYILVNY